ncbi:DUF6427 family protein [Lutibacter sp.]
MIANFFNKTKPVTIFNIVVLLLLYYVISFLLQGLNEFSVSFLVTRIGYFLLLILFLVLLKFIIKKNRLTRDNSYALLLVVLLVGTFSEVILSSSIIFSNILLLLSYRKIYSLGSGINTKMKLFDAGFWIGIATLLNSRSIFYILLIYIGIIMYRKGSLKNVLIPIIGLATPIFIYFTYSFYYNNLAIFYSRFKYEINWNFEVYYSLKFLIPILFLAIVLVWSLVVVTPKIILISNKLKSSWNVLIIHLLISVLILIVTPIKNGSELFYIAFPIGIIIANFLERNNSKIIKNALLYLFLILSIGVYFL